MVLRCYQQVRPPRPGVLLLQTRSARFSARSSLQSSWTEQKAASTICSMVKSLTTCMSASSRALMVFPVDEKPHSPASCPNRCMEQSHVESAPLLRCKLNRVDGQMELLESDSVTESKHLGPMSPVSVSTEAACHCKHLGQRLLLPCPCSAGAQAVSPDAPSSADTTDRR